MHLALTSLKVLGRISSLRIVFTGDQSARSHVDWKCKNKYQWDTGGRGRCANLVVCAVGLIIRGLGQLWRRALPEIDRMLLQNTSFFQKLVANGTILTFTCL